MVSEEIENRLTMLEDRLERIETALVCLPRMLGLLEQAARQQRGPRDGTDVELVAHLARTLRGSSFTAEQVFEHARLVDSDLRNALESADITTPGELGQWLGRFAGVAMAGCRLVRGRRGSSGRKWALELA